MPILGRAAAERVAADAGLKRLRRAVWLYVVTTEPTPLYREAAVALGLTTLRVCAEMGRARRQIHERQQDHAEEQVPCLADSDYETPEEADLPDDEVPPAVAARRLLRAMRKRPAAPPPPLAPEEGDRDRVTATPLTRKDVEDLIRNVRWERRIRLWGERM